ncbi:MAG: Do family serine endopeptidase [Candidatus Eisenbacteria bacterium]|nr:Do family serine endopeptidase [Candidatus Eisenbacteria bacterium]
MGRSLGWLMGSITLIVVGVILGFAITANMTLAPVSVAQDGSSILVGSDDSSIRPRSPFIKVAQEVLPAVVSVDTKRTIRRSSDPFEDMFRQFFGRPRSDGQDDQQYREYEVPGSASGFIFEKTGYIMTNNHVVNGADDIEVTLMDGREFKATIVGQDPNTDVAVIKIEGENLPTVRLGDSDGLMVGDWAIAVGNPLDLKGTVTVGVISAMGRVDLMIQGGGPLYQNFIQTDASINFGNSGGPLVNIDAEVIGVNTAINASANGIGFAIPINLADSVAEALIAEGKVVRGFLGVRPQEITRDLAEARNLQSTEGVIIASVESDTPASKAGLEPGDVVTQFGDTRITDVPQFRRIVASIPPGEKVRVTVIRDGRERTLTAELEERRDTFAAEEEQAGEDETQWYGLDVVGLNDPMIADAQIDATEGVFVVSVESGSPASDAGIISGDIILKIDDRTVKNIGDYRTIMRDLEGRTKAIAVLIERDKFTHFVAIKPE